MILLPVLFALWTGALLGDSMEQAVDHYRQGHYDLAVSAFESMLGREPDRGRRAVLHFNAGTAAARGERLGLARWHLESAQRLNPGLDGIQTNLDLVESRLGSVTGETSRFGEMLLALPRHLSEHDRRTTLTILSGTGLLLLACRRGNWLKWSSKAGFAGWVLLCLAGVGYLAVRFAVAQDMERTIVVTPLSALRTEPSETAEVLSRVGEGAVVTVEDDRSGWVLIETPRGARGWVSQETVRQPVP